MSQKNGDILAIGEGEADIEIRFPPNNTSYQIDSDGCDPTPVSCNPYDQEYVRIVTTRIPRTFWQILFCCPPIWIVTFSWNVFAAKRIVWSIAS